MNLRIDYGLLNMDSKCYRLGQKDVEFKTKVSHRLKNFTIQQLSNTKKIVL